MKISIIGASGFVGSAVLIEALARNHHVTAIARDPEKITISHVHLVFKRGDILNDDVSRLVSGNDAVISAYNPGWNNPEIYKDYIKGSEALLQGVKQAGIKRFLVVGGAGSLEISPGVQLVDRPDFPAEWKQGALAARDFLNILRKEQHIEWTFLSPAILLQPGNKTNKFRLGTDQPVYDEKEECKITVADLAIALIDELEKPQFIRKRFTVGY